VDKKTKCDQCDAKAVITEVVVKNGEKHEQRLCEKCAAEAGIAIQSPAPVAQVLTQFVVAQSINAAKHPKQESCSGCGLQFAQFRKEHHLGCPDCYTAFEAELGPLIERAHEGGTHHIGKVPRRTSGSGEHLRRIASLKNQLEQAVGSEQFERAAKLRDQIRRLEESEVPDRIVITDHRRSEPGIREA